MLTKLAVRNFKRLKYAEIELGSPVVFVGPNNSGKTTALQAIALWDIGLKKWNEKRKGEQAPEKRPGVAINRRDLIAVPVPDANLLWHDLHVRDVTSYDAEDGKKKTRTRNIRVDILVEGVTEGAAWTCGLEFDYANEESLYCRPQRLGEESKHGRMPIPDLASKIHVAFLPPMSGLAANETRLDPGAINVRLGEGRTAEVLRNLCFEICEGNDSARGWQKIHSLIESLFGVNLDIPVYVAERGEITMTYRDRHDVRLDLSSAGRGLQQTLLLLAHLVRNRNSVLLIDEPDAHLEILRQRQIYQLLCDVAQEQGSQIIAASHSEVVLNEAADRDTVVAFVGAPHRIDDRGQHVLKALKEIGFDQFYQAEQTGWVVYLEGSTDLAILRAFAGTLEHTAAKFLERPFVCYVGNVPRKARSHFFGLLEAKADLVGLALFDHLSETLQTHPNLSETMWSRREIENYLCTEDVLLAWAKAAAKEHDMELAAPRWTHAMRQSIDEISAAMRTLGKPSPWDAQTKVTDDFLNPLFAAFFKKLQLPNLLQKTDYHRLAALVSKDQIDSEVAAVLDRIVDVASRARPLGAAP
ncbi:MAG: AAA family ATPase [Planctomycetia bacterium]|nr:AAA family ATPase [Planctomycetia bacterium]